MKIAGIRMAWGILFLLTVGGLHAATPDDQKPKKESMFDRITRFPAWNDPKASKMTYEGKQFGSNKEFTSQQFETHEYAGTKTFDTKSFETRQYADSGKNWLTKLFPSKKKLPENLQGTSRDATKQFETGAFATKAFKDGNKGDPYAGRSVFETKQISMKGKTQGAIDSNLQLQEAVRKGLSFDDVRKLLNKVP